MLATVVTFLLLTEAFAVVTFAMGWWAVAVLAVIVGLAAPANARSVRYATICAAAGWAVLLVLSAARGPVREVAFRFGGVMGIPPLALFGVTLLFPALLAWAASSLAAAIRTTMPARRAESSVMDGAEQLPTASGTSTSPNAADTSQLPSTGEVATADA
jgi:hypothetical protein